VDGSTGSNFPHNCRPAKTKTLGHKMAVKYRCFWPGQKRPSFVRSDWDDQPMTLARFVREIQKRDSGSGDHPGSPGRGLPPALPHSGSAAPLFQRGGRTCPAAFVGRSAQFQAFARPQAPLREGEKCLFNWQNQAILMSGARHLGNVG
jgi:hypothetical protein